MWILTPLHPGGVTHYLIPSKDYIVGRKNCDILLPNDQSISRAHSVFTVNDQTLTLKDTSKYGTFVNSERVVENIPVTMKAGDVVTFGVFHSKFSLDHLKPVACSSCLDNEGKASVSQALVTLGGKLVNTWTQDCTHLIMPTVKVTIKTISALLCCCPIVKPEFFLELNKAVQQKLPPPKVESFTPEIDEPSLKKEDVNLGDIKVRKQLFNKKTFIFLSAKQQKRLSAAVSYGGGSSQLLEEGSLPQDLLESPQSCVVDVTTANSQILISPSATEWANSVKNIVQRKGLRVITESEIGLAAIYASCDKYCNPSGLIPEAESIPKVKARIPSASLSQSVAVDETVLPAASQNITAFAPNTEQSQGMQLREMTGVTAVRETPQKKQRENTSLVREDKLGASQFAVADTMNSSLNTVENTNSQNKKLKSKPTVSGEGSSAIRPQLSTNKNNGGMKTFPLKQSPEKTKVTAQTSPQKQSTLTSFFQPLNKKRPLEEFSSMSDPKRPLLDSSINMKATDKSRETYSHSARIPAATLQTSVESGADLFTELSDSISHAAKEEPLTRKRKEMEADIQVDELMSIMSEDMDCADEQPSHKQLKAQSSAKQKQCLDTAEVSSLSKRQRVHREEKETSQSQSVSLEKNASTSTDNRQKSREYMISFKEEQVDPSEYRTSNYDFSKPLKSSFTGKSKVLEPFEDDDDPSFIEDVDLLEADMCQPKEEAKTPFKGVTIKEEAQDVQLLKADLCQPKEESKTPVKGVAIKQQAQVSQTDEDLPEKEVLVEFRSLTVALPPKTKPKPMQSNGYTKNFKFFRKSQVPGISGSSHIIGGSDLLVHNEDKNSDLDEWLKDVAEEERQSRRDETVGDDLFRYNPTKLSKRR